MKEYIDAIDWSETWEFLKEYILPNMGWFIFWILLFIVIGLILSIVLNVYLYRKNIFTRDRKYYNWFAKLWIPYIVVVFIYFSGMFGLFYSGHFVLERENKNITSSLYAKTIGPKFSSEQNKKEFLTSLQEVSNVSQEASKSIAQSLVAKIKNNNSGMAVVDNFKNSSCSYLYEKYESEIYSASIYGLIKAVDKKAGVASIKKVDYSDFKLLLTKLDKVEPQKIEQSIQAEISLKIKTILDYFYKGIMKHEALFLLLFLSFPFIEYLIYLKFIKIKNNPESVPV
ncbi:hypothetical protein [Flavobacterium reichenbachii]|uniref:Uncharacterized protein n=1 Tax=Flavobacterium reichenbachii TaxID=362418 RepID=A0A085ZLV0_9FLAO|nr:hypothetical protein [Flavobacterium reichenbachii]KFF05414.1 hypothetical protein IW19_07670 [Flavobacterium reichenbachii]OXB12341.1 hypothetical protein B0A68_19070 [Flavobacterium reichenbachii]